MGDRTDRWCHPPRDLFRDALCTLIRILMAMAVMPDDIHPPSKPTALSAERLGGGSSVLDPRSASRTAGVRAAARQSSTVAANSSFSVGGSLSPRGPRNIGRRHFESRSDRTSAGTPLTRTGILSASRRATKRNGRLPAADSADGTARDDSSPAPTFDGSTIPAIPVPRVGQTNVHARDWSFGSRRRSRDARSSRFGDRLRSGGPRRIVVP